MKNMTKKQARDIARIWVASSARHYFPDLEPDEISQTDGDKITAACIELGEKMLKNDPSFEKLTDIIEYVLNTN